MMDFDEDFEMDSDRDEDGDVLDHVCADLDCDGDCRLQFADPTGRSALRAATPSNPRNLPCPTCGEPNRLTPADQARGYQCDDCAERAEGGGY